MPYICATRREEIDSGFEPQTSGELNYALTKVVHRYLGEKPNYQAYNDAIGALEGAKLELYRRHVAGYEDKKITQNGDV